MVALVQARGCVRASVALAAALLLASGCGFGTRTLSADLIGTNSDGALVSMGHDHPPGGVVSYSFPLVWNRSDRPLTLTGVTVVDWFGDLEPLGALIGDGERNFHAASGYDGFPQDFSGAFPAESLHPLEGYVLQPIEDPDTPTPPVMGESMSVIVGLRVAEDPLPAGLLGICVRFRDESGAAGTKCNEHQFVICEPRGPCPVGFELEEYLADQSDGFLQDEMEVPGGPKEGWTIHQRRARVGSVSLPLRRQ